MKNNNKIFNDNYEMIKKIVDYVSSLFYIDGLYIDDVRQELYLYVISSIQDYKKEKGALTTFVRMICWRQCSVLLRIAKKKSNMLNKSLSLDYIMSEGIDGPTLYDFTLTDKKNTKTLDDFIDDPSQLLSEMEMEVIKAMRDGSYKHDAERYDNARTRIITKFKKFFAMSEEEQKQLIAKRKIIYNGTKLEKELYLKEQRKLQYQEREKWR